MIILRHFQLCTSPSPHFEDNWINLLFTKLGLAKFGWFCLILSRVMPKKTFGGSSPPPVQEGLQHFNQNVSNILSPATLLVSTICELIQGHKSGTVSIRTKKRKKLSFPVEFVGRT